MNNHLDIILAGIEARQLQFLLRGTQRKAFEAWLRKPAHYKEKIRQLAAQHMPLPNG